MALIKPDLSEAREDIVAGTYRGVIKGAEVKEWQSGDKYVNWTLETVGDAKKENNGRRIYVKTSLSGKGIFMLQNFYKAATGSVLKGEFDTEMLMGRQLEVTLVDGVRDGQPTGYIEPKAFRPVSA